MRKKLYRIWLRHCVPINYDQLDLRPFGAEQLQREMVSNMLYSVCLLVTDRNPRVRGLLYREMLQEGYKAYIACTVQEVEQRLHDMPCERTVVILDPEWLDDQLEDCLLSIQRLPKKVGVIIHTYPDLQSELPGWIRTVEKQAGSVEEMKQILHSGLLNG